ncbi:MAG: Asp-tRNA(Asn)/Glu-tRNA(Gln) amidotransferase subunit GatB [Bacteroidetes bacterium]|nr:Asp-tRNA(Asn)/Glu-tRNA(Gln) amidotransferase subunit GatB [Bacteroidota bacterium]
MPDEQNYEAVIGLEVHIQLLTQSKLFCGDSTQFGAAPNSHVSAISLAHPGTLPLVNNAATDLAILLGLALDCEITQYNYFARKHYFYPDLPKGFQVTQHTTPICKGGTVPITVGDLERKVKLNRIHLEEDAGKSVHDVDEYATSIDLNRAGVPLMEMVTEPDLFSSDEAFAFLTEVRRIVRYLHVCDGNMEEGSMRCDANVSVRKVGDKELGTKVEIKNLNSIRNVKKAIEFEINRQKKKLIAGEKIIQQTRSFNADEISTFAMREKEEANDYRYFPEPDVAPFIVSEKRINDIRLVLPELPGVLEKQFIHQYNLTAESARIICDDEHTIHLFEEIIAHTSHFKAVANWIIGPVKNYFNEHGTQKVGSFPIVKIASLIDLVEEGKLSFGEAASKIFPILLTSPDVSPIDIATDLNLFQEKNADILQEWVSEVLNEMPDKVVAFKKGKKNLIGLFAGEVKKKSKGKADMAAVNKILLERLK